MTVFADYDEDPERDIPWCPLCDMRAVWRHGDLCDDCATLETL
jgi:hypothetical protein